MQAYLSILALNLIISLCIFFTLHGTSIKTGKLIKGLTFFTFASTFVVYTFLNGMPEWMPMSDSFNKLLLG